MAALLTRKEEELSERKKLIRTTCLEILEAASDNGMLLKFSDRGTILSCEELNLVIYIPLLVLVPVLVLVGVRGPGPRSGSSRYDGYSL